MGSADGILRVGVVGTGALGRHHVRILAGMENVELVGVFDLRHEVAEAMAKEHGTKAYLSLADLASRLDAAVVAVPTTDHAKVGCELLEKGIHVLVEKPIASSLAEADQLVEAAKGLVLGVGHVEFYNPADQAQRRQRWPRAPVVRAAPLPEPEWRCR